MGARIVFGENHLDTLLLAQEKDTQMTPVSTALRKVIESWKEPKYNNRFVS
jgi:hypothetical protein